MNKKGMDISLNFIILAVLALIALIVIALFFTGGLTNLFKQQEAVGDTTADKIALANTKCELYCTTNNEASWSEAYVFDESDPESTFYQKSCADLKKEGLVTINKDFVNGECVAA